MKNLILIIALVSGYSFAKNIQHNDVIKSNYLKFNVDGLELWDIDSDQRDEAIEKFYDRCLDYIPNFNRENQQLLSDKYDFFNTGGLKSTYKVVRKFYRGYGTQLLCYATFKTCPNATFKFTSDYSQIFSDRNGTEEICRSEIQKIDETAIVEKVFTRRAYFTYSRKRDGSVIFPKCQTLKIRIKKKKANQLSGYCK